MPTSITIEEESGREGIELVGTAERVNQVKSMMMFFGRCVVLFK